MSGGRRAEAAKGRPALLEWAQLRDVLRRAEAANLSRAVRMAHRLCAFTVARISNVVEAEWSGFDLDADVPLWVIRRAKMKARDRHHDHKVESSPTLGRFQGLLGYMVEWRRPSDADASRLPNQSLTDCPTRPVYQPWCTNRREHVGHVWLMQRTPGKPHMWAWLEGRLADAERIAFRIG